MRSFSSHKISRRRLLAGGAGFAGALVVGCGGDDSDGQPAESTQATATATATGSAATTPAASATPGTSNAAKLAELEAAAKREGKLTFYSSNPEAPTQRIAKAFEDAYGIKPEILRQGSGPLTSRYATEAESGTVAADVILQADPIFAKDAAAKGWLTALTASDVPALDNWPSAFWDGFTARASVTPMGISINTDLVKEGDLPTKWTDVLNPKWKGRVVMVDPRTTSTFTGWLGYMQELYGDSFIRDLGQQAKLVASSSVGATQLGSGEAAMMTPSSDGIIAAVKGAGGPVANVLINPGTGIEFHAGVSAKAPNPNAARLFMNLMLTEAGQAALAGDGESASPLPNVPKALKLAADYQSMKIAETWARKEEIFKLLGL